MTRRALFPVLSVALIGLALAMGHTALSIDPAVMLLPTLTMAATGTPTPPATHTPTATATTTPTRAPTELPDCHVTLFQGEVCAWSSKTAVVPLPRCGTPDPGQACVRQGAAVVTMVGMKP